MSKIALTPNASGSGTFTIAAPNSNTDRSLTLPDEAGTVLTSASDLSGVTGVPASGTALFSARFNTEAWSSIAAGAIVPFNTENFDSDGVYNTSTYKFTAPADGVYLFWWSIYTAENDSDNRFCFFKNDAVYQLSSSTSGALTFINGNDDHMQTVSIVIPLASTDTMQVRSVGTADYYSGLAQWGGVRIS